MREEHDVPIAALTTMRVGGPAARLVTAETTDELVDAVREVDDADEPLLVPPAAQPRGRRRRLPRHCRAGRDSPESPSSPTDLCGGVMVRVAAGEVWDDVVPGRWPRAGPASRRSGIPGCAGATPVQNVGAYGQEVAQTIASVRVWDRTEQRVRTFSSLDCAFTYRHSIFKAHPRYVVLDVLFQLIPSELSQPVGYADLARQLGVETGSASRWPTPARRSSSSAATAAWCSTDDHDTWLRLLLHQPDPVGAGVRGPRGPGGCAAGGRRPGAAALRRPRRQHQDQRRLAHRQGGLRQGLRPARPGRPVDQAHAGHHQPGRGQGSDVADLARELRDGVRDTFGVTLVNEPVFVGHSL